MLDREHDHVWARRVVRVSAAPLALALAGCSGSNGTVGRTPSVATSARGYSSAVAAVEGAFHARDIMYGGLNEPTMPAGPRGLVEIGWQSHGEATGIGWTALVRMTNGRFYVTNCKDSRIVHG